MTDEFTCDRCGKKTDTLYFHGEELVCDECRRKLQEESEVKDEPSNAK